MPDCHTHVYYTFSFFLRVTLPSIMQICTVAYISSIKIHVYTSISASRFKNNSILNPRLQYQYASVSSEVNKTALKAEIQDKNNKV